MNNDVQELVNQLESYRCHISFVGEDLDLDTFDFEGFEALLDRVPQFENVLTMELARRIESVVDTVMPIFEAHFDNVAAEFGGLRKTRRALRGYVGPSFHHRAQRVYRNI